MKLSLRGRYFASIPFLLLSLVFAARAQDKEWTWKDRSGRTGTRAELDEILRQHKQWVESDRQSGSRADLFDADLRDAGLRAANLREAFLSDAVLRGADLTRADLTRADLTGADLTGADLTDAGLSDADLSGAFLNSADLRGAFLFGADLSEADLSSANLSEAFLGGASLRGAYLFGADLRNAVFEPGRNPLPEDISGALNLDLLKYQSNPVPLRNLGISLRESDFELAHRQVTAALHRHNARLYETILFDWTTEYGANPFRAIQFLAGIWLIFTLLYWGSFHIKGHSGLYLVASGKMINTGNHRMHVRRLCYHPPRRCRWYRYVLKIAYRELKAIGTASTFSLMSAFNIRLMGQDTGRWIRLLQFREFDIKARGWTRFFSGTQALLSFFLIVLTFYTVTRRLFDIY